MRIFGKRKLSELEAAGQFVAVIMNGALQNWPDIADQINGTFNAEELSADDEYASYEFFLAVIACQIQALPNLLPAEQAQRVRQHVINLISAPELGDYPFETIQQYQSAWDQSVQQNEKPWEGLAGVLFDKLECQTTVNAGDVVYKSPSLLLVLSMYIVTSGGPWWKSITKEFRLVP